MNIENEVGERRVVFDKTRNLWIEVETGKPFTGTLSIPPDLDNYKRCRERRKDFPDYCVGNMCCYALIEEIERLKKEKV